MPEVLTRKQAAILRFLRDRIGDGLPPTVQEIADEFKITAPTAWTHLRALERRGQIRIHRRRARGIELVEGQQPAPPRGRAVPIIGRVVAGGPFLSEENYEGTLCVDGAWGKGSDLFALRVYGDSMVGAGILDGDLVIARPDADAREGDIVVACIGPEATVKRLSRQGKRWYLRPENRRYSSIPISGDDAAIQGKVLSVVRPKV